MVKVFKYCIQASDQSFYKSYNDAACYLDVADIPEIEKKINEECPNIKDIKVNTYIARQRETDTQEVWALFTVIYDEPNVIKEAIDEQTYMLEKQARQLQEVLKPEDKQAYYIEGFDY
jgi:hypothetical protein